MKEAISDYSELLAAIAKLPQPPAGTVRVFRGQTVDYPILAPSGLRNPPRLGVIWKTYADQLFFGLTQEMRQDQFQISSEYLQARSIWFDALAQHYGPGSDFLDVTYSIDTALWFALNKASVGRIGGPIGLAGSDDDFEAYTEVVRYDPVNEPGWLYVFDLPLWNGEGLARAGEVIDLAKAPEVFASSPRMRAQSACLIYCRNADRTAIDVRKHLVAGTPLQVRRPMTGTAAHQRHVADVYPSPEKDDWFARFLSVPMSFSHRDSPPALERSIPVGVYHDHHDRRYLDEVLHYDVAVAPPLVHRDLPRFPLFATSHEVVPTVILLEAPMVFPHPTGDSDQWHHGLLWTDVPDRCPEYDFDQTAPAGEVSLANVFFEFSLLEDIGWERVVRRQTKIRAERGAWLRRSGETLEVAFFAQDIPGGEIELSPFFSLSYDSSWRRIMIAVAGSGEEAVPINALKLFAKPVFVVLKLLRNLSATLKCEPTPTLSVGDERMLFCARDAARLYRVRQAPYPDWFVLRSAQNPEDPFTRVVDPEAGIQLTSRNSFWDFPLEDLLQKAADLAREYPERG